MLVKKIQLSNFRNFTKRQFEFSPETTVVVGPNAIGKTNILESLSLLSTGKSFHARIEEEMIGYEDDIARVTGQVGSWQTVASSLQNETQATSRKLPATNLEVVLTRGQIKIGESKIERINRKQLLVNGVPRRMLDFAGNFKTVLFGPWDMDLVTAAPSLRRKFLDNVLSQVDREYHRAILSYEKGLRQRNKLLFRIREEHLARSQLLFWDQFLVRTGNYLSQKRKDFIEFINSRLDTHFTLPASHFYLEYDPSTISEVRLAQYAQEEVAAATTLVGPHRDDFVFKIADAKKTKAKFNERELARYGSRGEQRMGVLWLKLAELAFIEEITGEKPTLLLDDIFSELDHEHREIVMRICQNQQTIITTADKHFIEGAKSNCIIEL